MQRYNTTRFNVKSSDSNVDPSDSDPSILEPSMLEPSISDQPSLAPSDADPSILEPSFTDPSVSEGSAVLDRPVLDRPFVEQRFVSFAEDDITQVLRINNIDQLKRWIERNFYQITGYRYYRQELKRMIERYRPRMRPQVSEHPELVMDIFKQILKELEDKWKRFDISFFESLSGLKGSKLAVEVENHKQRVSEIIDSLQEKICRLNEEADEYKLQCMVLEKDLVEVLERNEMLQVEVVRSGEVRPEIEFLIDFQGDLSHKKALHSSLIHEFKNVQDMNEHLRGQIMALEHELVEAHKKNIEGLAALASEVELLTSEELKNSLWEKINTLSVDRDECMKAVSEWMIALRAALQEKKETIDELKEESKSLNGELSQSFVAVQNLSEKCEELAYEAANLKQIAVDKEEENRDIIAYIDELEETQLSLSFQADEKRRETGESMRTSTPSKLYTSLNVSDYSETGHGSVLEEPWGSPERFIGNQSPVYQQQPLHDSYSLSLEDSGPIPLPSITLTPPSPMESYPSQIIPDLNTGPIGPRTQTISQPRSRIVSPAMANIDPSTQTMTGVKNRFDIGKSLNLHTVHSGTPSPYRQVTRVDSTIPQAGPSRLVDSPLNVKHMADFTPSQFVTPFISKSRFGYTDPKAKFLNLPPGDNYDLTTGVRKKLLLTSPHRKEPLLVNIDVDPKPLVQTVSGEHFICDISLDVQQAGKSRRPDYISPVFKYGSPPAITPTTTRRHGLFTPRGIFKKRHYNVRRVVGPDYDSPGEYFPPHHLPFDWRSPVSALSPVSLISDGTISWEKVPDLDTTFDAMDDRTFDASTPSALNRTFEASAPQVLNRTFQTSPSSAMDRTFDASPVIKGPTYTWGTPEFDSSYESSSSPMIKGPSYTRRTPELDRSYESSSSPVIKGPSYTRRSPELDRTFDRSQSPAIQGLFDRSSSPLMDRTFERSQSPVIQGLIDRSSSSVMDRTFDSSSSPLMDRTFDRSQSPVIQGLIDRSPSPLMDRTFDRIPSPALDRTFDASSSPAMNRTFVKSPSPAMNRTFVKSPSPTMNRTFVKSPSPALNQTYVISPQPSTCEASDLTSSPRFDISSRRYFERDSPQSGASYDTTSGGAFDLNKAQRLDDMFPRSGGAFDLNKAQRLDSMFQRSGGAFDLNKAQRLDSMFPRSGAFDLNKAQRLDGRFERSMSPRSGGAIDLNKAQRLDGRFESRMSPRYGGAIDLNKAQRLDRRFERSMPPSSGAAIDLNQVQRLDGMF